MRFDTDYKFWVVTDPQTSYELGDILQQASLADLALQFKGGLTANDHPTLFTEQDEAEQEAQSRLGGLSSETSSARRFLVTAASDKENRYEEGGYGPDDILWPAEELIEGDPAEMEEQQRVKDEWYRRQRRKRRGSAVAAIQDPSEGMSRGALQRALQSGPYMYPGGYPMYFLMADGEPMCFECVEEESQPGNAIDEALADVEQIQRSGGSSSDIPIETLQWLPVAYLINEDVEDLPCANCHTRIPSAYEV